MSGTWVGFVNSQLPLPIERAEWEDPVLLVGGSNWSLQTTSTWRIVGRRSLVAGSEEEDSRGRVPELVDRPVIRCSRLTDSPCADLRLELTGGWLLEVFVATCQDAWVLRLPSPPTLVPGPDLLDDWIEEG